MQALKDKILSEGQVIGDDILKVDGFLNHQIDTKFLEEIGCEFKKRFEGCKVDKILTVEASGIAVACETAKQFGSVPVVFAKKQSRTRLSRVATVQRLARSRRERSQTLGL